MYTQHPILTEKNRIFCKFIKKEKLKYHMVISIQTRAVKVSALIYEIIVAEINAIKYFNAVYATLFTSGVCCPLTRNRRVPT